jgi:hypothetical protein
MSTYCFRVVDTDEPVELVLPMGEHQKLARLDGTYELPDGRRAWRDFEAEMVGKRSGGSGWPMWSDAMGCDPSQIPEMSASLKKMTGMTPEFHPETGELKCNSRGQRRAYMRAMGLHDRNGGYGD